MNDKFLKIIYLFVFLPAFLSAQASRTFGLAFDEAAYNAVPMIELSDGAKGIGDLLPVVSLRPFCPMPGDQGAVSACTGFAVGYGAMSISYMLRNKLQGSAAMREATFSAHYIYNSVKKIEGDCSEGIGVEAAMRFLKSDGNCRRVEFDTSAHCTKLPDSTLTTWAKRNRIRDFAPVLPYKSEKAVVINTLKTLLNDSVPVVIVLEVPKSFAYLPKGEKIWKRRANEPVIGLHCMVVTGYDEDKRLFEVMSSWGTDWADGGFAQVKYEDMGVACLAAYIMAFNGQREPKILNPIDKNKMAGVLPKLSAFTLSGSFEFRQYEETDTEDNVFVSKPVLYDPKTGLYELLKDNPTPVGTLYQLQNRQTEAGKYIYMFSCDARGSVKLHYPKPGRSALNPGPNTLLTVPSLQSALKLTQAGDEFVVMLYSETDIMDIQHKIKGLSGYTVQNFHQKLKDTFKEIIQTETQYEQQNMHVKAKSTVETGTIVPIVLHLKVE